MADDGSVLSSVFHALSAISLSNTDAQHGPVPSSIQQGLDSRDLQALEDFQTFIHQLFVFRFDVAFYKAMVVAAGLLFILVTAGCEFNQSTNLSH